MCFVGVVHRGVICVWTTTYTPRLWVNGDIGAMRRCWCVWVFASMSHSSSYMCLQAEELWKKKINLLVLRAVFSMWRIRGTPPLLESSPNTCVCVSGCVCVGVGGCGPFIPHHRDTQTSSSAVIGSPSSLHVFRWMNASVCWSKVGFLVLIQILTSQLTCSLFCLFL